MKVILKRYRAFIITMVAVGILALINHQIGLKAISISAYQFEQMLFVIPPFLFCSDSLMYGFRVKR